MKSKSHAASAINRRDFVKSSAALSGGILAGTMPLQAGIRAGSVDDTIKVGLIGCGGRGTGAAVQALSTKQNVKLVAMADAFQDRLETSLNNILEAEVENPEGGMMSVADHVEVPQDRRFVGFDGYEKVIPLVDVVLIATPPGFRPAHFEAAINADKHVFMEKPLATDAPGVRQVMATAEKAVEKKLNVVVGLQRHYQTVYREWVDKLHNGAIGDIIMSRVYWNSGGVWVRERKPEQTEMEYQMRNWYYFNWLCGDHIVEQHIHNLDVGNWVHKAYPVRANGLGGRQVRTGKEHGEIYDHHYVEYEYADGSRMISACRHIRNCMNRVSEAFHGTNGTAPEPGIILDPAGNTVMRHNSDNDPNPYQVEHDELFAAVANGDFKYADAENGAKATMTAILGRMATYSGQLLEWDDAIASDVNLMPERLAWDAMPKVVPDEDGYYPVAMPGQTEVA